MAAGFFAVAIQAVIAGQIVGDVEPGDPPTVVPVQAGNVNVGIVEGADVKLDSPGASFSLSMVSGVPHWSQNARPTPGEDW